MDNEIDLDLWDFEFDKLADDYEALKKKREADLVLFKAYKKDPSPQTFQPLYRSFKPVLYRAAQPNMFRSPVPQSAHLALAAQSFMDALRTFEPSKGSLTSHVFGAVRDKGKRLNYKYQNIGYIPEARSTKYQLFHNTVNQLKEVLGREPSTHEIADEIKWSPRSVETMRIESRKDLVMDENIFPKGIQGPAHLQSDKSKEMFQDILYDLIPAHQVVLEHAVGLHGKQIFDKPGGGPDRHAIAKATGQSLPQVNSAFKSITRKVREYRFGQIPTDMEENEELEAHAAF